MIKMKRKLWLIVLFSFLLLLISVGSAYGLFETNAAGVGNLPIAKWVIKLNDVDLSSTIEESINANNFNYTDNSNIQDGYIAPGRMGYYDLVLDPTGCEVALIFDITFNLDELELPDNITVTVTNENMSELTRTGEYTYSGIISLDDINEGDNITLHLVINWLETGMNDESDTVYALNRDKTIEFPIDFHLAQYLGEELVAYQE